MGNALVDQSVLNVNSVSEELTRSDIRILRRAVRLAVAAYPGTKSPNPDIAQSSLLQLTLTLGYANGLIDGRRIRLPVNYGYSQAFTTKDADIGSLLAKLQQDLETYSGYLVSTRTSDFNDAARFLGNAICDGFIAIGHGISAIGHAISGD
jgi:hypothetical protein